MQYKGNLYGKIGGKYIRINVTAADYGDLIKETEKLIKMVKAPIVLNEDEFIKELYATADRAKELIEKINKS